jgi:molybdopterin-containing oxidoreductase family membrane subunit
MVNGPFDMRSVSLRLAEPVLTRRTPRAWWAGFLLGFIFLMIFLWSVTWLLVKGVGIWGINVPIAWAFAITNFVWWIGIGHAGTLISAILLLLRQEWRTSINRFAEAMTLFAVACAGLMPLLHLGRPWDFYWLLPYPNTMGLWPQFRSPLVWDVFAVSTYFTVSLIFWYCGLLPDLATFRDVSRNPILQRIYGVMCLGWRNSAVHWKRYQTVYFILGALATPLVVSVHSVVSMDFAVAQLPGWHSTIFPPYFVTGAIFSGFAMTLTLAIPLRKVYHLEDIITLRHLENMAKVMLATGLFVDYSYIIETFMGYYGHNPYETFLTWNRLHGPYAPWVYLTIFCNMIFPQTLWFERLRRSIPWLFLSSLVINTGMWLERFVIIVVSLQRDWMPSSWAMYYPTIWDIGILVGSMGLFTTLFMVFVRTLPPIPIFEMRELVAEKEEP